MNYLKTVYTETTDYLKSKRFIFSVLGLVLLLALWQLASLMLHEIMIASPIQAFSALFRMFGTERFWEASWITAQRAIAGVLIGGFAGFVLGIFAGLNDNIRYLFEPLRWMIMSISPVIVVGIAMLMFGMGSQMVIIIAAILLAPIVYVPRL